MANSKPKFDRTKYHGPAGNPPAIPRQNSHCMACGSKTLVLHGIDAAAPDLLAALKKYGVHAAYCSETNNAHCGVCAAVAKAVGEGA